MPQGPPVGRTTRPATSRDRGWILPSRYDKHRQHYSDERIPFRRRRALAVSFGCRTKRAKGSRHRRIHRCRTQSDDSHVIVLEPGLIVYKIYNGYWFFGRPTLEDLRQDLRAILQKCRPDWDITTPEMKTAWKEDRKDLFYPYGKTYAQTIGEQD